MQPFIRLMMLAEAEREMLADLVRGLDGVRSRSDKVMKAVVKP